MSYNMREIGKSNDVRIMPIQVLDANQRAIASRMLVGDKTCSLKNMHTSCFASERCNSKNTTYTGELNADSLMATSQGAYAIVRNADVLAVATTKNMSSCSFLGLTSCAGNNDILLTNLCVNSDQRSNGVGRMMIDYVKKNARARVYVSVRLPNDDAPPQVKTFMQGRSATLISMYKHFGFTSVSNSNADFSVLVTP